MRRHRRKTNSYLPQLVAICVVTCVVCSVVACTQFKQAVKALPFMNPKTLTISEFAPMYDSVLANLTAPGHFMWQDNVPGSWAGDWTYDAGAFAPGVLFRAGRVAEAKLTMDYVSSLNTLVGSMVQFMVGFSSYVYGPEHYSEKDWCFLMGAGVAIGTAEALKTSTPLGDLNGYICGKASVAYTSLRMANVCLNTATFNQGKQVYDQVNNTYWDTTKGYYYDPDPLHQGSGIFSSFQNGAALSMLAFYYAISHDDDALAKIEWLYAQAETQLWEGTTGGGYEDLPGYEGKDLGANLLWLRGWLWVYYFTGDVKYLNKSKAILDFISADLLIDDIAHPGYKILSHDWYPNRIPKASASYCTGCNFLALECIQDYNLFKQGPIHTALLPISPVVTPGCSHMAQR